MPRLCSSLLLLLGIASSASAVTTAWTPIGNPGNPADTEVMTCCIGSVGTSGYGSVGHYYSIGTYEVTNSQYVEFLNAKASTDPLGLYDAGHAASSYMGIARTGAPGSYTYSAIAGRENMPVNFVTFYDALRFSNWMNNGQGNGDTESGSYTLLGGSVTPSNAAAIERNAGATIVLPSENEWYKAAYYDPQSASYFNYPMGTNFTVGGTCTTPTAAPNSANCDGAVDGPVPVGSYTGSASPYGTFDQGGNLWEWNEAHAPFATPPHNAWRVLRGSDWLGSAGHASVRFASEGEVSNFGFRLAMIVPEPGTGLLVIAGLFGLAGWRRAHA
jgi:formylglycine-generating enzyme required for sulfatase activity